MSCRCCEVKELHYEIIDKEKSPVYEFYRNNPTDAGLDIRCNESGTLLPHTRALISTGIKIAIPIGNAGIIKSRSGLAVKNGIEVGAGVIDENFRGELRVLLHNTSNVPFSFEKGDRIAQLLLVPVTIATPICVELLDSTDRGNDGFGSSGIK